jgi:tRNA pseudouridine38-40 synthase
VALGLSYVGTRYAGWQSQADVATVQDALEKALNEFAGEDARKLGRINVLSAGRTDAGVHAAMQVAHFDTHLARDAFSWIRGTNRYLPADIAVHWAAAVPQGFHARASAQSRRYAYIVRDAISRTGLDADRVGWVFRPLNLQAMQQATQLLLGTHDFSSFRAAACQAPSPIKTLLRADVRRLGSYWRFDFEADAFLHHMIRNIMGCLIQVGQGTQAPEWITQVIAAKNRDDAAPTFSPDGLYFLGPRYDAKWGLPDRTEAFDFLPGASI